MKYKHPRIYLNVHYLSHRILINKLAKTLVSYWAHLTNLKKKKQTSLSYTPNRIVYIDYTDHNTRALSQARLGSGGELYLYVVQAIEYRDSLVLGRISSTPHIITRHRKSRQMSAWKSFTFLLFFLFRNKKMLKNMWHFKLFAVVSYLIVACMAKNIVLIITDDQDSVLGGMV